MIYWELFLGFLRVGCFTFGGGYAAVPLIREVTLSHGWLTEESLTYMIAVSESTPGPIMVNMATYVGSSQAGFWGAVIATTAVVIPSFVIILLIMALMKTFIKNRYVQAVFRGLKPCVIGIILATGLWMIGGNLLPDAAIDWKATVILALLAAVLVYYKRFRKKPLSPIILIAISACLGIVVYGI